MTPDEIELDFAHSLGVDVLHLPSAYAFVAIVMLVSAIGFADGRRRYYIGEFEVMPVGLDWVALDLMPGRDRIAFLDPTRSRT